MKLIASVLLISLAVAALNWTSCLADEKVEFEDSEPSSAGPAASDNKKVLV
jgi:hypothetical protein